MRSLLSLMLVAAAVSPGQQMQFTPGSSAYLDAPRFPSGTWLRQHFDKPIPHVELQPPTHLPDFVTGDKLELSLRSYLELVLANNTDIQIQKLTVETQRNAITRAFSAFDPVATTSFRSTRAKNPTNDALAGAATLNQLTQPFALNYNQTLDTGTIYNVGFSANKNSTNSAFANFNPSISTGLNVNFIQPLLRNRGRDVNRLPIVIAKTRLRSSQFNLSDQVMRLLQSAELAYWAVIEARESLKVQEQALQLYDTLLKRSQRELDLGAISPLEIYQPQQQYASQEVFVTQARYRLAQAEDGLRRQMGADLDSQYRAMPINLTETVLPPADERPIDKEQSVQLALQKRPDLRATMTSIEVDDLTLKQAKNSLLPDLSLTGTYTSSGRGGPFYQRENVFQGDGTSSTIVSVIPGGIGDALNQTFNFNYPTYGFGLTLRLPIRDRRAQADFADAVVSKRLDTLRARMTEQNIRLDVLNAVNQVENSRASVKLAQVRLDFSQKRVEAEQKRYDLGVTTIFFVIQAQNDLVSAQADLVQQSVQYRRNLLNLQRVTGQLLEDRGVVID
ncbi:MAG: TolC family protein [Bryobacterales bacterium]|nr:TolC family protein [Bryobacterales bacterium]